MSTMGVECGGAGVVVARFGVRWRGVRVVVGGDPYGSLTWTHVLSSMR